MHIKQLTLEFRLSGCRSLKEKRQRLGRLRDKFGRFPNLAVCEAGFQDSLQRARWSFVAVGSSGRIVEKTLMDLERNILNSIDAELVGVDAVSL